LDKNYELENENQPNNKTKQEVLTPNTWLYIFWNLGLANMTKDIES